MPPRESQAPKRPRDTILSSQGGELDSEEDQQEDQALEHNELFGTFRSDVVGVQYYDGLVGRGEYVLLQRDANNEYDSNAVRVVNAGGSQVGHIPRAVAALLARPMDSNAISVEGRMIGQNLDGARHYQMGLDVSIYINNSRRESLEPTLRRLCPIQAQEGSLPAAPSRSQSQPKSRSGSSYVGLPKPQDKALNFLLEGLSRETADVRQADKVMDALTGDIDVSTLPLHPSPPGIANGQLAVDLLPHQSQALRWMIARENPRLPSTPKDRAVQFWVKQKGMGSQPDFWLNVATKTPQSAPPKLGRGGIIADGMGLGKTLTTIALVLATQNDPIRNKVGKGTLIVCPLSVLSNWEKQLRDHVAENQLTSYVYHGAKRDITQKELELYDIVITTYQTLASEFGDRTDVGDAPNAKKLKSVKSAKGAGTLGKVSWKRVVADEGHQLKNPKAKMTKAFASLKGERRWVCTGTPIINSPTDLGSLLTCLHICAPLSRPEYFRALLLRPLMHGEPNASKLLQALVSQILLRRTKDSKGKDGKKVVELPPIEYFKVEVEMDEQTRKVYEEVLECSRTRFEETMRTGEGTASVLALLTRMRQLCLSLELVPKSFLDDIHGRSSSQLPGAGDATSIASLSPEKKEELIGKLRQYVADEIECGVCMDETEFAKEPSITDCGHPFCLPCIKQVIETRPSCPMDRHPLTIHSILQLPPPSSQGDYRPSSQVQSINSAKIDELVKYLHIFPKQDKTLVFSQFTSFLDCVGKRLDEEGIKYVRFDGRMSEKKRTEVIEAFQEPIAGGSEDTTPRVMLISLKSGAVGLNLTAASNVFLCDPWWQSAIEAQAIDRTHRMGQTKTVRVFQLIAKDTVEGSVLDIQKRKDALVAKAFEKSSKETQKTKREARFEDIKEILGMR